MKTPEQHEQEMLDRYQRSIQGTTEGPKASMLICPQYYNKPCALCDLTYQFFKTFRDKNHPRRDQARNLNRKFQYYMNVVLPPNPSEVVLFNCGKALFDILWGYFIDEKSEYKGYTDPTTGRNLFIIKAVPGGNTRQTKYGIEMRIQPTPLPDPGVLSGLYNLDKVVEVLELQQAKILYQTQLSEGRTEIRILPSWLGPKYRKFYEEVPVHFMNRDEFNAIQAGKVSPFADLGIGPAVIEQPAITIQPEPTTTDPWKGVFNPPKPDPVPQETKVGLSTLAGKPPCFGTYETSSPLCTQRCSNIGWMKECARETALKVAESQGDQDEILRRTAAKLYR